VSDLRGLLFTSIPKAGKNIIYSFFHELGYSRLGVERDLALSAAEEPWLRQAHRAETYALPAQSGSRSVVEHGLKTFLQAVSVIKDREIIHHHFPYTPGLATPLQAAGVPVVFVYRDPRDVLVSMADYILVQKKPMHLAEKYRGLERVALVERLWTGDGELVSLPTYFEMFAGWRNAAGVISARFEALIGEKGGGSSSVQRDVFAAITQKLGDLSAPFAERACRAAFNPRAGTYYKGRIGRWNDETDPSIVAILTGREMTELAVQWGYGRGRGSNV
jgi:sulfotransferase 6B1